MEKNDPKYYNQVMPYKYVNENINQSIPLELTSFALYPPSHDNTCTTSTLINPSLTLSLDIDYSENKTPINSDEMKLMYKSESILTERIYKSFYKVNSEGSK
jgi:hypothetical protein